MLIRPVAAAVAAVIGALSVAGCSDSNTKDQAVTKVDFIGMDAPATTEQKADMYSGARVVYTFESGATAEYQLQYHKIFDTTTTVGGNVVGGLYSAVGSLGDNDGQMASDAPDGTSLMTVSGLSVPGATGNPLAMVTQFEYKALPPNDGVSTGEFWSKMPAAMGLTLLDQGKSGMLAAKTYTNIDMSGVKGGWIFCGSTLSSWNTHVGSEEYEPDAKVRGGGAKAADSDDATDINSFSKYYFGNAATANPYHYGLVPEVTVDATGKATVVKHYAPGRFAREMQIGASDSRTFIAGDDGKATGLFMFVADSEKNLSAGTIYAAKVTQTAATGAGSYTLQWIRLGQASDADIRAMVDSGVKFSDIFQFSNTDPGDATYKKVVTYTGTEWLKVKPGMQKAAAFLETRRYAALLGATTEFSKMEYVAYNPREKEFYVVISRIETLMIDGTGDIKVSRNDGGAILKMATAAGIKDSAGGTINSSYAGTTLATIPELVGGWSTKLDAEGNACNQTQICGPDNIVYVDKIRTLFIGEDTSRRNNNYVWAFNIDDKRLTRILSTPMYAEATGLMAATDYNGHAYVMSNFQHAGDGKFDGTSGYKGSDAAAVGAAINQKWGNRKKAAIGYLGTTKGALPAFN
jgi:secreted PhoX family phosphatase